MLGYGETSKATNPADYRQSLMSKDLTEILDSEGVKQAAVIGHDWGAYVAARFALFQPERTLAVGFITVGYMPPNPGPFDLQPAHELSKQRLGYEVLGYWEFFAAPDAAKVCMENFEAFFNVVWPDDSEVWRTASIPLGAMRKTMKSNEILPAPSWMSEEDKHLISEPILKNGLEAPMCYYQVHTLGLACEDDKLLEGKAELSQPVFFLDALDDLITCEERFMLGTGQTESPVAKYCKNATVKRIKVDHWVMLRIPDELNAMLLEWLETF
ncbi:hypothetical protein V5O48_014326 [Marasmius crinis-equi]|uniref:AB hydrolase-1 domain-containing protein n=1 Tax=Marasmius crinis-equi TaxID=585013 RepID=A0ABR3EXN4_9AGAR